jgi:hypothetical protein
MDKRLHAHRQIHSALSQHALRHPRRKREERAFPACHFVSHPPIVSRGDYLLRR